MNNARMSKWGNIWKGFREAPGTQEILNNVSCDDCFSFYNYCCGMHSSHFNCISTLRYGYHRWENKGSEKWSDQTEVKEQGLHWSDINLGHWLLSTTVLCIPEQQSCVWSGTSSLYVGRGTCASPCRCCRTVEHVSGVSLRVQLFRVQWKERLEHYNSRHHHYCYYLYVFIQCLPPHFTCKKTKAEVG